MVYLNLVGRTSSRLLSATTCQQQIHSLLVSSSATVSSSSISAGSFPWNNNCYDNNNTTTRSKHSSTQIKRLFKQNPAKRRIALKEKKENGVDGDGDEGIIPESTISPIISEPIIFKNGWNPPLGGALELPDYPFRVARTRNKPNNAVGFLPVYSEHRKDGARVTTRIKKVSGDRVLFVNELRAALQIPIPKNPKADTIRIRTGGTIEVKGNRALEVKTWLAGFGF